MLWMVCRWVLALPLVLFEGVSPRSALWESAKRSVGHRRAIALAFAAWAVAAALLSYVPTGLVKLLGREVAPLFAGSVGLLLLFMVGLAFLWGLLWLAAGILSTSAVALLLNRVYHHLGDPRSPVPPAGMTEGRDVRLSRRAAAWIVAAAVVAAVGAACSCSSRPTTTSRSWSSRTAARPWRLPRTPSPPSARPSRRRPTMWRWTSRSRRTAW